MKDAPPKGINLPPVIGPNQGPVTNGTPYPKIERSIEDAARNVNRGLYPVPNADMIKLPDPNQG